MRNLNFQNKNINYKHLIDYGFIKNNNIYTYIQPISNNNFNIIVEISSSKQISKLIDLSSNEEYILVDIKDSNGDFIGKLKEEYENILNDIIDKCTTPNIFKSKQAKDIINYIKNKYNDDLEYLWKKFPNNAIWRNKTSNKWYGAILTIEENKLGIKGNKLIEIIDLRYQKDNINYIVDNNKIYPGYHMNKDNWITIKLDNSVDIKEIYKLIDNSYELSIKKNKMR